MRKTISFTILLLFTLALASTGIAQKRKPARKPGSNSDFLKTQWWLGIRSGINYTNVTPLERFPGFNPVNYDAEQLDKDYQDFTMPAFHVGLDVTFYHAGFSISTLPTFMRHNITYTSGTAWIGDTDNERFETDYETNQSVTFIDLPLTVKYDFLSGKIRPFLMAGGFYSFVFDANKSVNINETDFASGAPITYERTNINLNNRNEFVNNWGVLGGIGASFDFWNIRTVIDIQYRHSFNSVVNASERYQESVFSSFGEIQDDYNITNYSGSISFVFPLRYIDSQFKAL